ncbi:hypothetical protein [Kribbella sp. NPDC051718]|uniref:hypothetical protein n=1 Tax=Kribbella sp. NPDC051718 TaxID=3155168 RepID=UPI003449D1F1
MSENHGLALILMGVAAIILYHFWKQILLLLLMVVITLLCFGIYSVAVVVVS